MALISGGARGQGATEVHLFVREGAKVVFGDVLDEAGRQVEAAVSAAGGEARYVHLNVTSESDWRRAVETAVQHYGKLNVLVNNAGILIRKGIEETTEDDWDRIMAVNVKGVFLGTKYAIPAMRRAGGGSIINISSTAGLVGNPYGSSAYTASKGGVRLFTKATAIQHAPGQHPLQLRASGANRHRDAARYLERPRSAGRTAEAYPAGQSRHSRRCGVWSALSRLR